MGRVCVLAATGNIIVGDGYRSAGGWKCGINEANTLVQSGVVCHKLYLL